MKALKGMRLLLLSLSLFLLKETEGSGKSYLIETKGGKTFLVLANPKRFTDGKGTLLHGKYPLSVSLAMTFEIKSC